MTQAQLNLPTQLDQNNTDIFNKPLFNGSPVLFLESKDETNTNLSEHVESVEHHNDSPKNSTPTTIFTNDHSNETPPPLKTEV